MKPNSFLYLFLLFAFASTACELFQVAPATQTAVVQTTVAASWTATQPFTPAPTGTEAPTPPPDPCAPEKLAAAVQEVNDLQRQFDDLSALATQLQREQVPDKITEMQSLLQTAADQETPPCLKALMGHQVKHMNLVIDTFLAFMDGTDKQTLDDKIKQAREEHDRYILEYAHLLGLTPTPEIITG